MLPVPDHKVMTIRFDIDGTIIGLDGKPDYDILMLILMLRKCLHCRIVVGSGGGIGYAEHIIAQLGLDEIVTIVPKVEGVADIWIDDKETALGKVDLVVIEKDYIYGESR